MPKIYVVLAIIINLFMSNVALSETRISSEQEFINLYKKYHAEKNLEKLLALYYFEGTPDSVRASTVDLIKKSLPFSIANIKLQDIDKEELSAIMSGFPHSGKLLVPNGMPLKNLVIKFNAGNSPNPEHIGGYTKRVGLIKGNYLVLGSKYADDSLINNISIEQLDRLLKLADLNKTNWPIVINAASKLLRRNVKLPDGYQELLKRYKTGEDAQYIEYTLYDIRERGHHGGHHTVWFRVFKNTGLLWQEVRGIPDMPIYDKSAMKKINENYGDKVHIIINSLKPIGDKKRVSKLQSTASVTSCKNDWTTTVYNALNNNYSPQDQGADGRWHLFKINEVIPINCATIDYNKFTVAIMYCLLNAENTDEQIIGNKLLWISKFDKQTLKLTEMIYSGISNEGNYDLVNDLNVSAISDINGDDYHDIILINALYAGEYHIILQFEKSGAFKKIEVEGAGWD